MTDQLDRTRAIRERVEQIERDRQERELAVPGETIEEDRS
jgi:hypothetical protein